MIQFKDDLIDVAVQLKPIIDSAFTSQKIDTFFLNYQRIRWKHHLCIRQDSTVILIAARKKYCYTVKQKPNIRTSFLQHHS